ncbi:flavodoxin domain-containing protein [Amphibacillus cookii]|uniref:flavodoxin domain-containing protein n=1 Tax=Amphibacillus cookii TaxID=767787 RepID=UPI00195CAC7F|nr:flavodoxin domain-containing protein [Amphibacillus cookii]MBM7540752.1 menaquinone-dependent protoporphyrinogen IX oxidase [Amphibacillus cookii]
MTSILIVYQSRTGFTEKYVNWIKERITCDTVRLDQIGNVDLKSYAKIIYGAGIHAGHIQGLKTFKKHVLNLVDDKMVIFATGAAPYDEKIVTAIKQNNFSENERQAVVFFYFQSGLNYEKMPFFDKLVMKTFSKVLARKKNKSEIEDGTSQAITQSHDHSNQEFIMPMIDYLKQSKVNTSTST